MESEDVVNNFFAKPFHGLSYNDKMTIKAAGRPTPKIVITKPNGKCSTVNATWFARYTWLTGSVTTNRLYCWPCLLMGNAKSQTWSVHGFNDLKNYYYYY